MADGKRGLEASSPLSGRSGGWNDVGLGWTLAAELVTATFVWGGVGWLLDRWLGTAPVAMAIGFVVGNALGIYLAWLRTREQFEAEQRRTIVSGGAGQARARGRGRAPASRRAGIR